MSNLGGSKFAGQPLQLNHIVVDGVRFAEQVALDRQPTSAGANIFDMADRSRVVQFPYLVLTESLNPQYYEFGWTQQAGEESEWFKVDALRASGKAVWFIPYAVELEVWTLATGANTLAMARPLASAKFAGFETSTFKTRAFLNDVEQTVVGTSPPSVGEITVGATAGGKDVETPVLVAGDELEVRYYPAYPVVFPNHREQQVRFNEFRRSVACSEVNKQVPS